MGFPKKHMYVTVFKPNFNYMLNLKSFIILFMAFIIYSCKTEEQKLADKMYSTFIEEIKDDSFSVLAKDNAIYVSTYHENIEKREEAKIWLQRFENKMLILEKETQLQEQSKEERLKNLGGYTLVEIDETSKCNRYDGFYILKKVVIDSNELSFISEYLAGKLFEKSKKKTNCSYPVMAFAYVYLPGTFNSKEDQGEWISMCAITPQNYSGKVSINNFKIRELAKNLQD